MAVALGLLEWIVQQVYVDASAGSATETLGGIAHSAAMKDVVVVAVEPPVVLRGLRSAAPALVVLLSRETSGAHADHLRSRLTDLNFVETSRK